MDINKSQADSAFNTDCDMQSDIAKIAAKGPPRHSYIERISNALDSEHSERFYFNLKKKYVQTKVKRINLFPSARIKAFKPKLICLNKDTQGRNTQRHSISGTCRNEPPNRQRTNRKIRFVGIETEKSLSPDSRKYIDSLFKEYSQKRL